MRHITNSIFLVLQIVHPQHTSTSPPPTPPKKKKKKNPRKNKSNLATLNSFIGVKRKCLSQVQNGILEIMMDLLLLKLGLSAKTLLGFGSVAKSTPRVLILPYNSLRFLYPSN